MFKIRLLEDVTSKIGCTRYSLEIPEVFYRCRRDKIAKKQDMT